MQTIRTLIIDDEEPARDIIKHYLKEFTNIEIIGECSNGFEGIKAINELKPDLTFLDIQMPKLNGFELLELIDHRPVIIFSTAFDQYALKAFELNALDYLLKPYSQERFSTAVNKVIQSFASPHPSKKPLVQLTPILNNSLERIVVKNGTQIKVLSIQHICCFEAQDDYVLIYTNEGNYLKQITMKYLEAHLPSKEFVRTHRSYIVRIDQISQIEPYEKDSFIVRLKNNIMAKISNEGYKKLRSVLNF